MRIELDDHYARYTNGVASHQVMGETIREGLSELCNRFPQLLVHLQDRQAEMCKKSGIKVNGDFLISEDAPEQVVTADDVVELTVNIPHGDSSVVKYIVGAVLIVVGAVLTTYFPALAFLGKFMIQMGVSMIISTAVMDLFFTPETPVMPAQSLLDNSATYTFTGIRNTTASGTPIQVVYGQHRVGGHVVNMYTTHEDAIIFSDVAAAQYSYLYAQIGLCEGEIDAVEDIQINQLPQQYYNEVSASYRLGSSSQTAMADHTKIMNTTTLDRKVVTAAGVYPVELTFATYNQAYGYVAQTERGYQPHLGLYVPTLEGTYE